MTDTLAQFNQLMSQSRFGAALQLAVESINKNSQDVRWTLGAGRAALALGRLRDAADSFARAERLVPSDPECQLQIAIVDHRLARSESAERRLRTLIQARPVNEVDAQLVLAEVLHRTNQSDALQRHMLGGGEWLQDPRATLFLARLQAIQDPVAAINTFDTLARGSAPSFLRRIAGFEAVKLLDRGTHYREAFDMATFIHASTGSPFDVGGLEADIAAQKRFLNSTLKITPRANAVTGTAMIVGLPRSGTTLLEQMLDRHPAITGIGEYEGVQTLGDLATASGLLPDELSLLSVRDGAAWQRVYCEGAAFLRQPSAQFTLDKSLHTWRWLPVIAAVLPGTVMLAIEREARDTAISTFLGNFHPSSFGWTGSLDGIHRIIGAHRSILPAALERFGFCHEAIQYESLVEDPAVHAARCLARMGLAMDRATISPESNARTVLTLSYEQVRKPINRASIRRWCNYEWAFDGSWNAL